jgi:hypothetical protein
LIQIRNASLLKVYAKEGWEIDAVPVGTVVPMVRRPEQLYEKCGRVCLVEWHRCSGSN